MKETLRRLSRKTVCEGKVLDFCEDTVRLPDGRVETWDFVHHRHGGGACVVPVLPDGRIVMVRQFRPAVGLMMLELPAGARDPEDADTALTALRELREETGFSADRLDFLARIHSAPAFLDETTDIYLAKDIEAVSPQHLDEAEDIRIEICSLESLTADISEGRITDAKTVAGLMAYAARVRQ
ncbi:MAG: NUDIX hydrolase [Lachnospiraceae bacterium]|nr:NUDIX hydrolase [Lachnospiraceae bacterium]